MAKASNISQRRRSAQAVGGSDYAAKREELVRIAGRLFKEQGYQTTRLVDIAKAAGLDRATIYYYVGSKEELFQETVEGSFDAIIAESKRLQRDDALSAVERLHAIYVYLMASYEENYPATFVYIQQQMHQLGAEETAWAQEVATKTRAFGDTLMCFIREATEAGDLRSDIPPRIVWNALFGMLNWTHRWFVPGGAMTGRAVAEAFWSIFLGGMRPEAADTRPSRKVSRRR